MNLSSSLLKRALKATLRHGYGAFFAEPPELGIVKGNWTDLVAELSKVDLDTYQGYDAILSFAPKSRLNVRRVGLLHPNAFYFLYRSRFDVKDIDFKIPFALR